jgi:hypothetical protein
MVSFTARSIRESPAGDVLLRIAACCTCSWIVVGNPVALEIAKQAHVLSCRSVGLNGATVH